MRNVVLSIVLGLTSTALARDEAPDMSDWRKTAVSVGFSEQAIDHLEREKVLMTRDSLLQCFQAYLPSYMRKESREAPDLPWFITSDALFHAYAVCLQKSVSNMEGAHAEQLRAFLEWMLNRLQQPTIAPIEGDPSHVRKAVERALFVVGVAARLMEVKTTITSPDLQRDIQNEVSRIQSSQDAGFIQRLGMNDKNSEKLDFTLFKPAGFYSSTQELAQYFQAVRWLQLAPFRLNEDEDMLAAALLSLHHLEGAKNKDAEVVSIHRDFQTRDERLCSLAGPSSRPLIFGCMNELPGTGKQTAATLVAHARAHLAKEAERLVTRHVSSTAEPIETLAAYAISSSQLVDAALIESISRREGPNYFPDTLSIPFWLGSSFAAKEMGTSPDILALINNETGLLGTSKADASLHTGSLRLLQKLFATPQPNAPAFMKNRAWQTKSCQTALSAWIQTRHVWALQARPQARVGAGFRKWPAFVEPLPHFFNELATLCVRAETLLGSAEPVQLRNKRIARQIRSMADNYEEAEHGRANALDLLSDADAPDAVFEQTPAGNAEAVRILFQCADLIERGQADEKHLGAQKMLASMAGEEKAPFQSLAETCQRLALIATRQLRGEEPGDDDTKWLLVFGPQLAFLTRCHFAFPPDNVPKCVRIFSHPEQHRNLHAGIGRPCFLYVLYPWKGDEVLCRGAVLPYLESHEPGTLTDEEWRSRLDKGASSLQTPKWLEPLLEK